MRLAGALGMRGLPSFLGACGRLVISEGGLTPLEQYRQSNWETRWSKQTGKYLLSTSSTLDATWQCKFYPFWKASSPPTRIGCGLPGTLTYQPSLSRVLARYQIWTNMNISNLLSKVVLSTLEHLTPVARNLQGPPPQEEREPCNLNCFMEWKQEVPDRVNERAPDEPF